jgi:hypothetical protein
MWNERRGNQMSQFRFSVRSLASRQDGVIESESFRDAVDALGQHVTVKAGDILEIGVYGFPPAIYECVGAPKAGTPIWMPSGKLAA